MFWSEVLVWQGIKEERRKKNKRKECGYVGGGEKKREKKEKKRKQSHVCGEKKKGEKKEIIL